MVENQLQATNIVHQAEGVCHSKKCPAHSNMHGKSERQARTAQQTDNAHDKPQKETLSVEDYFQ